jgi:flagellar biosynthesis protein FlhG
VRTARVMTVTSGKGGAGKTNVCVNLGMALAALGRRTLLADCDVGLANANVLMGVECDLTIADVASRERGIAEVAKPAPGGMMLLPGHSGLGMGGGLSDAAREELATAFRPYASDLDHVIVDTGGGMAGEGLSLVAASDLIMLVLANEPTSFIDAYALVKALVIRHGCARFVVVTNRVASEAEGQALFSRFERVVEQFLPVHLDHLGSVVEDPYLRDAVYAKRCCLEAFPSSPASAAFRRIARRLAAIDIPPMPGGNRFFGLEAVHGAH